MKKSPVMTDVNSDQQDGGLESDLTIDRDSASRLGLTAAQIDNTLYDAFGQRQVSNIYNPLNQYHVVMEVAPEFWQNPETLHELYIEPQLAPALRECAHQHGASLGRNHGSDFGHREF